MFGIDALIVALAAPVAAPFITKGLAYILPPEWVVPMSNGIMIAARTKAGLGK